MGGGLGVLGVRPSGLGVVLAVSKFWGLGMDDMAYRVVGTVHVHRTAKRVYVKDISGERTSVLP